MDIKEIQIQEVGPREGFQFEGMGDPHRISVADKIRLIKSLTMTGIKAIQVTSFVSPKQVPQMADAEDISRLLPSVPGVTYTTLVLNEKGLDRALAAERYAVEPRISLTASEAFLKRNQRQSADEAVAAQRRMLARFRDMGTSAHRGSLMAAFGCNYQGDIPCNRSWSASHSCVICLLRRAALWTKSTWRTQWAGRIRSKSNVRSAQFVTVGPT